jgi:hypothetical protein
VNDTRTRTIVWLVVIGIVIVVAMNLLARGLDGAVGGREPGGADGSSYATQNAGLAGFTELLTWYGHDVRRIRGDLEDSSLSSGETVILADPGDALSVADADALRSFVRSGGRLLLAGVDPAAAARIVDDPPETRLGAVTYRQFAPELDGLRRVVAAGSQSYVDNGDAEVLARNGNRVLAQSQRLGAGEVVLLADISVITNAYLARADNAALGLSLAGDDGRIVFLEGVHGYKKAGEDGGGMSAIPSRWKYALLVFAAAAIVFAWARGRRLGPADRPRRDLPPARAEYVDALSGTLALTGEPGAALDHAPRTEAEILALGRAAARVTDGRLTP